MVRASCPERKMDDPTAFELIGSPIKTTCEHQHTILIFNPPEAPQKLPVSFDFA